MAPSKASKRKSESPTDGPVERKRYSTRSLNKKTVNYQEDDIHDDFVASKPSKKVASSSDDDFEIATEEQKHHDITPDHIESANKVNNSSGINKKTVGSGSKREASKKNIVKAPPAINLGFKPVTYDANKIKSELNLSDDSDSDDSDSDTGPTQVLSKTNDKKPTISSSFEVIQPKLENEDAPELETPEVANNSSAVNPWMKNLEALKEECQPENKQPLVKKERTDPTPKKKVKTPAKQSKRKSNKNKPENPDEITVAELLKLEKMEDSSSDEEDENWEKVKPSSVTEKEIDLPKSVEVTLDITGIKRKKKSPDIQNMIRLKINRIRREIQLDLHQVSLVGLLAHGYLVNRMLSDPAVMATALSIVPQSGFPPARTDLNYLEKLVKWLSTHFKVESSAKNQQFTPLKERILTCISSAKAQSIKELVCTCVALCRSLGILSRLVISLQPLAAKVDSSELQIKSQDGKKKKNENSQSDEPETETSSSKSKPKKDTKSSKGKKEESKKTKSTQEKLVSSVKKESPMKSVVKPATTKQRGSRSNKRNEAKNVEVPVDTSKDHQQPKRTRRKSAEKPVKYEESSSDGSDEEPIAEHKTSASKKRAVSKEKPTKSKGKKDVKQPNSKTAHKRSKKSSSDDEFEHSMSEDSENDEPSTSTQPVKKEMSARKTSRKIISPDSEATETKVKATRQKKKIDVWMEIYLEQEEQWMSVDVVGGKIHCDRHLESNASEPLLYVVAFNQDLSWKDVTARYASSFLSTTRKQRAHPTWTKLLDLHREPTTARSKAEDESLEKSLTDRPMPTSISELKSHPLYALQRHLLKFEAIYPPSSIPVGYIRSEPVYARECVKNLHSRETWLKEAKVVKIGEKPYKIVKARPKWDRYSQKMITDQPLELFGDWQIEDYIPPPAVDGIVPRNAYGNVELFLPTMLPKGTKHLPIAGLNKIARKLGIDCAPAMTGWDFHGGWSHPVYDGFVVCEEHVDTLMDAWRAATEEQEQRERDKIEKRVYGNWRRLIRGLLIRERLQAKYFRNLTEDDIPSSTPDPSNQTEDSTSQAKKGSKRPTTSKSRKVKN